MCKEIWKDIPEFPNYQVSNMGNVRNLHFFSSRHTKRDWGVRNLSLYIGKPHGYLIVNLHNEKGMKQFLVHRLVAMAFIPNPENKPIVDHINTNRLDNHVSNLRWVTPRENIYNPISNKKLWEEYRKKVPGMFVGGKSPLSKKVIQMDLNGNTIKIWDSMADAYRMLREKERVQISGISQACNGIISQHAGYKWKFMYCQREIEKNKEFV